MIPPAHHRTRREQRDDDEAAHGCHTYSIMGGSVQLQPYAKT